MHILSHRSRTSQSPLHLNLWQGTLTLGLFTFETHSNCGSALGSATRSCVKELNLRERLEA